MLNSEPDHGLEVVQTVSRVIATAAEDHAVDTSSGCGRRCTLLQCIGQLDLVATTGRGLCQDLEYRRVQDVAPDHCQVARGVSGVGFLDQPRDANHGSVTVIPRSGVDGGAPIHLNGLWRHLHQGDHTAALGLSNSCLLYTSPSPRDGL